MSLVKMIHIYLDLKDMEGIYLRHLQNSLDSFCSFSPLFVLSLEPVIDSPSQCFLPSHSLN